MRHAFWVVCVVMVGLAGSMAGESVAAAASPPAASANAQVDTSKLGAPIYPGSVLDVDYGPNKYKLEVGHSDARFITKDALTKVEAFYKAHMPANSSKRPLDPKTEAKFEIGNFGDTNYTGVMLMTENDENGNPDGTQIDLVHYWVQK